MKAGKWVGLGVVFSLVVVVLSVAGWIMWERMVWRRPVIASPMTQENVPACDQSSFGVGLGMMERWWGRGEACEDATPVTAGTCDEQVPGPAACNGQLDSSTTACNGFEGGNADGKACTADAGEAVAADGEAITITDARAAVERYIENLGYGNLEIDELMEFELNFYAIVVESDTGIGAMELLIDKSTGAVGPEIGPNMMWNARYGMHRRGSMMGRASETNTISAEEALSIAQKWLDGNLPGATTEEHADPFYGYYTIHTLKDGVVDGMLSVHGTTGQVWYHSWHGAFIQMVEYAGD